MILTIESLSVCPRESGDPARSSAGTNLAAVVPAQAGTHNHQGFGYRWPCHIALLRRMGPRLRGDDSGELLPYAILLLISPIPSTQIFTTSPALRYSPRPAPTPAGVPVRMRSPGCRVRRADRWAICSARLKIILPVLESCLSTPLTHS